MTTTIIISHRVVTLLAGRSDPGGGGWPRHRSRARIEQLIHQPGLYARIYQHPDRAGGGICRATAPKEVN